MRPPAAILWASLLLCAAQATSTPPASASSGLIIAVNLDGVIHPITVEIVRKALAQARDEHASAVLLRLNTPGGLLESARQLVTAITTSPVPVIAYVTPSGARAASAGFFLLEASDIAAMAPGTNTGAASPVLLGQTMDPVMRSKIENDTAAWLRSFTSRRGRNSELAETTVREAKAFTEREALDHHLIDFIAASRDDLLKQLNGRSYTAWTGGKETLHLSQPVVRDANLGLRERLIAAIADPNIAFILLILGALGIFAEFHAPGAIFPGVAGGILILIALSAMAMLPIRFAGVALLVLGMALFVLEAKFASHGVLGVGGIAALVLGALFLVDGPPEMGIHLGTALAVAVPFGLITMFLVSLAWKARANKALTGDGAMINQIATAYTPLDPEGKVLVRGEFWQALSSMPVPAGAPVRITGVRGLLLQVEPAPQTIPTH